MRHLLSPRHILPRVMRCCTRSEERRGALPLTLAVTRLKTAGSSPLRPCFNQRLTLPCVCLFSTRTYLNIKKMAFGQPQILHALLVRCAAREGEQTANHNQSGKRGRARVYRMCERSLSSCNSCSPVMLIFHKMLVLSDAPSALTHTTQR